MQVDNSKKKIHFIGIGGIGSSALARYFLEKGYQVSGSDLTESETTKDLKSRGVKIIIGKHKESNLAEIVNQVVYSPAVQENNPELKKAQKLKIKCQGYPESLGELTKKYWTIAVSGTHGKSTTSAMIAKILIKAGFDPSVIIGTKVKNLNSFSKVSRLSREQKVGQKVRQVGQRKNEVGQGTNFCLGKSRYLVIEADEWQASFLNYWPKLIVLTNIEKEHLDYYRDLEHILRTYKEYLSHLPEHGFLIVNGDDRNIKRVLNPNFKIQKFSLRQKEAERIRKILKVPGEHNVLNALAALTVARALKIPDRISFQALAEYKGSWRRFEIKKIGVTPYGLQITLINDYAHHPTEIEATLKAAREKWPKKEIWVIFQPHQYQRTFYLFDDFVKVFQQALANSACNRLIIIDIYDVAGRENKEIKAKVNAKKLVKAINRKAQSLYLAKGKIVHYLKRHLKGKEVIILMGAGDIYELNSEF